MKLSPSLLALTSSAFCATATSAVDSQELLRGAIVLESDSKYNNIPAEATSDGFTPIDGVYTSVQSVNIEPSCPWNTTTTYPNAMFTIQPSDTAYVSSSPANLVTATLDGDELKIDWNADVAAGATSGGVRIGLPSGQLKKLNLSQCTYNAQTQILNGCGLTAQILSGFTSVEELEASGASTLQAESAVSGSVTVSGASTANIVTTNVISELDVSGASTVNIQTPTVTSLNIQGASTVGISGSVGGGSVSGASHVSITGDISGSVSNSGASTVSVNKVIGSVTSEGASTVIAASCDNVSGEQASTCSVSGPPSVSVNVSPFDSITNATCQCISTPSWCNAGERTSYVIPAVLVGATTLLSFFIM